MFASHVCLDVYVGWYLVLALSPPCRFSPTPRPPLTAFVFLPRRPLLWLPPSCCRGDDHDRNACHMIQIRLLLELNAYKKNVQTEAVGERGNSRAIFFASSFLSQETSIPLLEWPPLPVELGLWACLRHSPLSMRWIALWEPPRTARREREQTTKVNWVTESMRHKTREERSSPPLNVPPQVVLSVSAAGSRAVCYLSRFRLPLSRAQGSTTSKTNVRELEKFLTLSEPGTVD